MANDTRILTKASFRKTVSEDSANTFKQETLDLNLGAQSLIAFVLTDIYFAHTAVLSASSDSFGMQVTLSSQTGLLTQTNPDSLWRWDWTLILTTSGASLIQPQGYWHMAAGGIVIARPQVFCGVKGTSLGATANGRFILRGYFLKMTEAQYLRASQSNP